MVDAWTTDTAQGSETALLAWRRADVDALNRLARHRWDQAGHLSGPDVTMTGAAATPSEIGSSRSPRTQSRVS
jgi:hypothetical protein